MKKIVRSRSRDDRGARDRTPPIGRRRKSRDEPMIEFMMTYIRERRKPRTHTRDDYINTTRKRCIVKKH